MKWTRVPNHPAKHGWAFYYFLKRRGDNPRVTAKHSNGSIDIEVVT